MRTRIFFPIVSPEIDRAPAAARTQKNGPRPGVGQRAVWAVLFNLPTERTAGRCRHSHSRSLLNGQRVIGGPGDRLAGQHLHHTLAGSAAAALHRLFHGGRHVRREEQPRLGQ